MSKEEEETRIEEILASIKDPKVREHYRAQLAMAAELEQEGVATAYHDVDVFRDKREKMESDDREVIAELVAEKISQQSPLRTIASIVVLALMIVVAVGVLGVVGIALWKGWSPW